MASDARAERAARNENVFRQVNERLHVLANIEESSETLQQFVCECFETTCAAVVELYADEYRAVRSNGARFLTVPDALHTSPEIENVVERHDRYWIVEKRGEAGREAEELAAPDSAPL